MDDASPRFSLAALARGTLGLLGCALLGAALAALVVPAVRRSNGWFVARAGDVEATAGRPAEARRDVLERYARSVAAAEATAAARRNGRDALMARVGSGPLPPLSAGAECAAMLRGWALALRTVSAIAPRGAA